MRSTWTLATALLSLTVSRVSAWAGFSVTEFATSDCKGWVKHASIGMKPQYWQVAMNNESNSVSVSVVNDGIFRWYGFSEAAEFGCGGKVVGRLWSGCVNLDIYAERIECIRWCSMWRHDDHSCEAIGQS
ncbi:hypothetical protein GGS23DRAFT_594196 [Durotheca rogersii]|uniref:uncharacterized protein n=1 Tax=Durotheca rogersii TaxID=419775 RepID=UPI002220A732|nr:uncharacterized protein GGS23DRAFT_594196 [Durotheca rogersii]KAI5866042.1 hypothetical protein GGS23DRAFT_594196 [Durotheca rogersii]